MPSRSGASPTNRPSWTTNHTSTAPTTAQVLAGKLHHGDRGGSSSVSSARADARPLLHRRGYGRHYGLT